MKFGLPRGITLTSTINKVTYSHRLVWVQKLIRTRFRFEIVLSRNGSERLLRWVCMKEFTQGRRSNDPEKSVRLFVNFRALPTYPTQTLWCMVAHGKGTYSKLPCNLVLISDGLLCLPRVISCYRQALVLQLRRDESNDFPCFSIVLLLFSNLLVDPRDAPAKTAPWWWHSFYINSYKTKKSGRRAPK